MKAPSPAHWPATDLRELLAKQSQSLHDSLLRSWSIAIDEWIPSIGKSHGSYNSLPHFRNIEYHLNQLLLPDPATAAYTPPRLTPLELYLLLASVLFHDFGRAYRNEDHAAISEEKVVECYSRVGIPTVDLARSLGAC